jgi:hypothetical protein
LTLPSSQREVSPKRILQVTVYVTCWLCSFLTQFQVQVKKQSSYNSHTRTAGRIFHRPAVEKLATSKSVDSVNEMQTLLQRNFSQNPISVATYCPFIDWHSSGGNTIATLKDACVSTKHQTSASLAFLVTLTATQRDSRTITWNRGSAFLGNFSCPGREWGLHP